MHLLVVAPRPVARALSLRVRRGKRSHASDGGPATHSWWAPGVVGVSAGLRSFIRRPAGRPVVLCPQMGPTPLPVRSPVCDGARALALGPWPSSCGNRRPGGAFREIPTSMATRSVSPRLAGPSRLTTPATGCTRSVRRSWRRPRRPRTPARTAAGKTSGSVGRGSVSPASWPTRTPVSSYAGREGVRAVFPPTTPRDSGQSSRTVCSSSHNRLDSVGTAGRRSLRNATPRATTSR
jgi:hypothetical protein